jgi:tetratricopeptide (TPR) repeat protein
VKRLALLALLALVSARARADVWEHAIETGSPDADRERYEKFLEGGDEFALQASSRTASFKVVKQAVGKAADSYRAASMARPDEAEPYFRLGKLLHSFYFECSAGLQRLSLQSPLCPPDDRIGFDRARALEVIAAWDAFEERAPLDPRLSVTPSSSRDSEASILFARAILHTKLATGKDAKDHLLAATRDYEKILSRSDETVDTTILGNLAETYMMLGRLDEAIDTYREALRRGPDTSMLYGLAVALDRDERGAQAMDLILSQGETSRHDFYERYATGLVFFVPAGEEFYYFALIDQAFGSYDTAYDYWQRYIKSGAHPEFQPRARVHIEELRPLQKKRPAFRLPFPDELYP